MVLLELGKKINAAFSELQRAPKIDDKTLDQLMKGISIALLSSDVNVNLVASLRTRVKNKLLPQLEKLIIFNELVALVNPTNPITANETPSSSSVTRSSTDYQTWQPKRGKSNVIMFVGLQGSGKTTSCTKLAVYYKRKGFKTALVCADTFRAGAFDQLKQNATKAKIPFFGSYTETDPIAISNSGVTRFKRERFEVIIVDTSGRHRQETELFEEMKQISRAVKPNLTIMVLDGAIDKSFQGSIRFGAIFVTKLDGHAKGGGAISAVAASQTPIMFIGTGEHINDLEKFSPEPFIKKLLGMGDLTEFLETMQDLQSSTPIQKREEMRERIERGEFTIRDLKDQMSNLSQMGSIAKIASMIPGMSEMMAGFGGDTNQVNQKMKRMTFIFDSMSNKELDSNGSLFKFSRPANRNLKMNDGEPRQPNRRILRVARASGTSVDEVEAMLAQHAMFASMVKSAGGKRKWEQQQALKQAQQQSKAMMAGASGKGGKVKQQQITIEQLVKMAPNQRQQVLRQAPAAVRKQIEDAGGVDAFYALSQAAQRNGGQPSAATRARRAAAAGAGGLGGGMGGGGRSGISADGGQQSMPDPETMRKMMEQMGMGDLGSMFSRR
ncbi:signal recognition particle protein [Phakopsora pachyrhizi]|uniref:signal-recognition-particle GTPase n=1 Tax=Phakopsora pachyrhizi TaxID=170000 RepID=A0AAV0AZ07_PHAPC|nr:signal recognition particle protein [Phakopsora pachyrhizi]